MASAARAIGWEFRQRYRWGLIALAGYFLVLATIKLLIPESSLTFNMDSGERFAVVVMVPLTATFLYVLTVFTFGLSGDVAGRQSMYPARMFTLPVSTTALTLWPMLYGAARFAVGRARRGEVPDWRGVFARAQSRPQAPRPFASPARAQAWFEWRRHGRSLPALVGLLLPFELALLWLAKDAPAFVFEILFLALITPPFMAACTAWTVSQPNPQVHDSYGLPPFIATRPLTSAELIAAKLKIAMWSTLAAWLLVLVAMSLALEWSGTWSMVTERARRMNDAIGTPRAAIVVLLILAGFIVATWKQLVQSLHIGLTGREWIVKGSVLLTLPLTIHSRPVRPMCKLCTSCFQVATMNPARMSSTTIAARGVPMASFMRRARSVTMDQVPDHSSASDIATSTSSHAASVLHIAIFSLAAMSSALVNGRVAMNGGRP